MIVAEFLFIAFLVGILTETWLGFLGTFFGLYALYRFTRFSAVLSIALSLYWGLLGYHLGTSTDELGVGLLLAALGFGAGVWVHRGGFRASAAAGRSDEPAFPDAAAVHQPASAGPVSSYPATSDGEIIDAEYRVVP